MAFARRGTEILPTYLPTYSGSSCERGTTEATFYAKSPSGVFMHNAVGLCSIQDGCSSWLMCWNQAAEAGFLATDVLIYRGPVALRRHP